MPIFYNVRINNQDLNIIGNFILLINSDNFFIIDGKGKNIYKDKFILFNDEEKNILGKKGKINIEEIYFKENLHLSVINKKQKEKEFQDYLEKDILCKILEYVLLEKDIKIIQREYKINSGIVDFFCGNNETNILVEVKINDIGLKEVKQIVAYKKEFEELSLKNTKSVIIGKKLKKNVNIYLKQENIIFIPLSQFK